MTVALADAELEAVRRRAFGVAYRKLGAVPEAEDVAQEALLRLARSDEEIREPAAWITTVASRLAINELRLVRARRETYVGRHLPESLSGAATSEAEAGMERADSLADALGVIVERLTPVERAALLLHDVFDYRYREVAGVIHRTEANARQIVARARKHLQVRRRRFHPDVAARDRLLERFVAAADCGDVEALQRLLALDV